MQVVRELGEIWLHGVVLRLAQFFSTYLVNIANQPANLAKLWCNSSEYFSAKY